MSHRHQWSQRDQLDLRAKRWACREDQSSPWTQLDRRARRGAWGRNAEWKETGGWERLWACDLWISTSKRWLTLRLDLDWGTNVNALACETKARIVRFFIVMVMVSCPFFGFPWLNFNFKSYCMADVWKQVVICFNFQEFLFNYVPRYSVNNSFRYVRTKSYHQADGHAERTKKNKVPGLS